MEITFWVVQQATKKVKRLCSFSFEQTEDREGKSLQTYLFSTHPTQEKRKEERQLKSGMQLIYEAAVIFKVSLFY